MDVLFFSAAALLVGLVAGFAVADSLWRKGMTALRRQSEDLRAEMARLHGLVDRSRRQGEAIEGRRFE